MCVYLLISHLFQWQQLSRDKREMNVGDSLTKELLIQINNFNSITISITYLMSCLQALWAKKLKNSLCKKLSFFLSPSFFSSVFLSPFFLPSSFPLFPSLFPSFVQRLLVRCIRFVIQIILNVQQNNLLKNSIPREPLYSFCTSISQKTHIDILKPHKLIFRISTQW